jgi:hypothetical protein
MFGEAGIGDRRRDCESWRNVSGLMAVPAIRARLGTLHSSVVEALDIVSFYMPRKGIHLQQGSLCDRAFVYPARYVLPLTT